MTKTVAELIEVTLDNYQVIECTPDHLFMTLGGEWVQAQHLTPDVSLMPLYRSRTAKGGWAGYERVWCPVREQRQMTHTLVGQQLFGDLKGKYVHHKDEVKHNNHPDNLECLGRKEHLRHHTTKRHQEDPEFVSCLQRNHRVLSIRTITKTAGVWDITVDGLENFALASGVFVHNSKDVSDALAGCLHTLKVHQSTQPLGMLSGLSYSQDAWMEEHLQHSQAGERGADRGGRFFPQAATPGRLPQGMLPPILGGGGNDGDGGDGGDGWGGGWSPSNL